jgi:PAS domain S-box-containing protein
MELESRSRNDWELGTESGFKQMLPHIETEHGAPPESPSLINQELQQLRAENRRLREQLTLRDLALDATPSFFLITRIEGSQHFIVYCNKIVADTHGVPREQLIGRSTDALTRWRGRDSDYRLGLDRALRAGSTFHYEYDVLRPDGTAFVLGVSIRPIFDAAGRLTHAVGIGADITTRLEESRKKQELQDRLLAEMKERERVAVELQLAQKLESVGRLAAGIAHEINTPIQYVGDSVEFLHNAFGDITRFLDAWRGVLDDAVPELSRNRLRLEFEQRSAEHELPYIRSELPRAFERIFDGVGRVSTIVKAMKEFAHPDAEEQSPADLNHALQTTLLVASNEYKYVAKVHTDFSDLPPIVCNIGELNQVFLNLIVNAAHAIHDTGKDSETGSIRISTEIEDHNVVIRLKDNGCGIPPENLSKLYDPFFTTKEVGRGTGQGLSIAHSIIVDKHAGSIDVASSVGAGTEFTVRIPVGGRQSGLDA